MLTKYRVHMLTPDQHQSHSLLFEFRKFSGAWYELKRLLTSSRRPGLIAQRIVLQKAANQKYFLNSTHELKGNHRSAK